MAFCVTKRFLRSFGNLYASRGCDSLKILSGISSAFGGIFGSTFCSIQSSERCSLLFACRRMSTSLLSPHYLPRKKAVSVPKFSQGTYDDLVIPVTNFFKEDKGFMLLAGDVFDVPIRKDVVHRVVRWQLAKRRKGNASTKTRGEVRGGGRKPWRQKGSGRARHGSIRSPLWKGGGVAHGPKPRSHAFKLQRKYRRLGLKVALSARAAEGRLMVFEDFVIPSHKTKYLVSYVNDISDHRGFLLVDGGPINPNLKLASQNLHHVNILPSIGLNVYSILKHPLLVMTREAVEMIVNRMHTPIRRPRSSPPKLS